MAQATRKGWLWGVLAAAAIVATARGQSGVTLSGVVVPAAAQPGVHTVAVTGSGFPAGTIPAANVTVTLVPSSGAGTSATAPATGVQGLYGSTRRVSFVVPAAIAVTTGTAYKVSIAGTTDVGTAFASASPATLTINPPAQILSLTPSTTAPGSTTAIQIVTRYTEFVAGATMASFGAGASVGGGPVSGFGPVSVTGPTTATAIVTMSADAAGGNRAVTAATGVQTATLAQGITVTNAPVTNQAPGITSSPATAATALQPYAYQATATDADHDPLTWALTAAPSGMTVVPGTGAITWTPAASLVGTHTVTVQVSDGKGGLDTQTFSVVVAAAPVNQAPHITTTPGATATAGQAYSHAPAATDADGDTLTWTLTQSPVGMAIMPGTGAITWTPGIGQVGGQTVTLSVSDGHGGTDSQTFAVAVARPPNQAPHITSSAVTSGRATEAYTYIVTATDPDSDPLTFALTAAPSGMTIGTTTGAISWTPTAQQTGSQSGTVRVDDGRGGSDTQSFSITVLPATNQAPSPRIAGPATGTVSQSLSFDASTSTDPDADPLTFSWAFGDGATATGAGATHSFATSGTFTVSLTANDGHGHAPTATRSVLVSPPANRPPVAVAGGPYGGEAGIPVAFSGTGSSDPDGNALIYAWSFGDQSTGTGASPSHAYAAVGTYTVTLTVSDVHQATNSATTSVAVAAAVDRSPPLVTLTAPRQALPGATVAVTVDARDNDKVLSVVLTIESETPTTFTAAPYARSYTLPAIAAPGSVVHLTALATDPSNNSAQATATITVAALPDTEPPTATLTAPSQAAPGTTVTLSADAHDNVGVAGVAFTVDGNPISTVTTPPYVTTWTVPSGATAGTVFALLAMASDAGGLAGTASASLTVVAVAAVSADPSVTLTVPSTVPAGGTVDLTAVAIADPTVASVAFTVDGARLATIVTAPYAARYTVPAGLRDGATLQVQAEVTDGLGRTARDTKTATVQASAAPGMGVLYGRVFNDSTGLAIAGATVTLVSTTTTATTDAQGRYTITASEGPGTLRVTKTGWSRVDRPVTFVAGNTALRVLDARLTPLAAAGSAIQAVVGGTVSQSGWTLVVPGGALGADTALVLTGIGGQGLQGRLPLAWAPVTTVDIAPHGSALAPAATLTAPTQAAVATLVLARWDETAAAWRAVTTATGTTLEAPIVSTGQYAWLRADTTPSAPAMPADGALLEGVLAAAIPEAATTRVTPDPKILFYSPGVFSTVTGIVTSPSALPSGSPLTLALNEVYHFLDGTNATPERVTQDLVAYQSPAVPTDAQAVFPATPSLTFEAISLRDGVITAALYTQGAESGVPLLGAAGGVVNGTAGEQLEIPPGAAPAAPMALATLTQADAGLTLPADAIWLAGITFTFSGELALPGRLSVAKPSGLTDASQVLLVRVRESNGQTQFLLAARARLEGDRLIADTSLPGSSDVLDGVRVPGRYVFVQVASPLAFSVGAVSGVSGAPFAGAMVTNDRLAIGALSTTTGRYAQAMPGGGVTLTAFDEIRRDTGAGTGAGIAGLTITVDLALVAQPPSVVSITPADGATSVALSDPIVVRFSEPVAPATVTAQAVQLAGPSGPVTASLSLTSNNTVATLRPPSALDANAAYTVTVDTTITDLAGYALPAKVTAHFTSLSTTPPPAPPAGNLSATIPSNGATTVGGTQGSAGLHDTVAIVNLTQKTSTPALVDPNGSFSAIVNAGLTDKLKIEITDPAGNKTSVDVPRFQNPDGSVAIGADGGQITATGDLTLDIADGTFPAGAIVKFVALTAAEFTSPVKAEWGYPMVGAFELTTSVEPQRYMNVSMPVPAGTDPQTPGIIAELVTVLGDTPAMSVVDTAKIVNGRLVTSSPPCPGLVSKYGRYAAYLNTDAAKNAFATSLLTIAPDVRRDMFFQGATLTAPFFAVPTPIYPSFFYSVTQYPASPFIALLKATGDPTATLAAAEGDGTSRRACYPVTPDTSMTVVLRDVASGAVVGSAATTTPAAGSSAPVTIYLDPTDKTPPTLRYVSWNPVTTELDGTQPVVLQFSEAVTFPMTSGVAPLSLIDQATGLKTQVNLSFEQNQRLLTITPTSPLPQGHSFTIVAPGLRDIAGNLFAGTLTFKTFAPKVIAPVGISPLDRSRVPFDLATSLYTARDSAGAPILTDLAFGDIDYLTLTAAESSDQKWHTWLFMVGGENANGGAALMVADASKPSDPRAVTILPGFQHYYTAVKVIRDFGMTPRVTATPPATVIAWNQRMLWYDSAHPSDRMCEVSNRDAAAWRARKVAAGASLGSRFGCGDIAIVIDYSIYYSRILSYDVSDPTNPQLLSIRLLSDNGPQFGFQRKEEAPAGLGMAFGFDVAPNTDITHNWPAGSSTTDPHIGTNAAYVAMDGVGLGLIDIDRNVPSVERTDRVAVPPVIESEGYYSLPYYQDVKIVGGRVVAIANDRMGTSGMDLIEFLDGKLSPTSSPLNLGIKPRYMVKAENVPYDFNGDGVNESHDMVFISGNAGKLAGVEVPATGDPSLVDMITLPQSRVTNAGFLVTGKIGTCPDLNVMLSGGGGGGYFVKAGASTTYHTGTCGDFEVTKHVFVAGTPMSATLTAPTVRLAHLGSGGVNNGSHRYLIVFDTPIGKFRASLPSAPVTVEDVNNDGQVRVSGFPTPGPFVNAIEIYRSYRGLDAPLRFVARIDKTATEYIDNLLDELRGDEAPTAILSTVQASDVTVLELAPDVHLKGLGRLTIDAASKIVYVAGTWVEDTSEYQGILAFDVARLTTGTLDRNLDGWDDRLLSKTKIIGTSAPVSDGTITGLRDDSQRKLIYVTYRSSQKPTQTFLAIVKTCDCSDASVTLLDAGIPTPTPRDFSAVNDSQAVVFITDDVVSEGKVRARFDVSIPSGTTVNFKVTEYPASGNPADALVDLGGGRDHGTIDPSDPRKVFYLTSNTMDGLAGPSVLAIDFTDDQGNFIRRSVLILIPGQVAVRPAAVRTVVDKTNRRTTGYIDYLSFILPYDATVTITVDHSILQAMQAGVLTTYNNVALPAGLNRIEITPQMIPEPGEHEFVLTAMFRAPDTKTVVTGALLHEVTLTESLPLGTSFEKNVSLLDGHLAISRTDISIPSVGPPLQFGRSYNSSDSRASGQMGAGWTHTYEAKVTVDGTGDVTVGAGDGGGGRFSMAGAAPGGGTLFKPQPGYHGTLIYKDGAYDYYSKVRYRYHFEASIDSMGRNQYRLTYIEDAHGNRQTIAYSGDLVQEAKDATGRTLTFTYEKKGVPSEDRVTRIDGPLALVMRFTYDGYGNLVDASRGADVSGAFTVLRGEQYDYTIANPKDRHNLTKVTDPNGNPTEYVYFDATDTFPGEVSTYTPGVSVLTVPMKYELVKEVREGSGSERAVTTFTFDYSHLATKLLTSVTDARGIVTTYTVNPRGPVTEKRVATAAGDIVSSMKWAFEVGIDDVYMVEQTDALGRVTTFQYDANGNVKREAVQVGSGAYAAVKDSHGATVTEVVTQYDYDLTYNKPVLKIDPEGNRTEWVVASAFGDIMSMTTDPKDGTSVKIVRAFAYGDVTTPSGTVLKGVLTMLTDPLGHTIRYTKFDDWGNAIESYDGIGNTSTFRYDARGRLVESSDGFGHHALNTYDDLDQVKRSQTFVGLQPGDPAMASPDPVSTRDYYAGGEPKSVSNRPGQLSVYAYDSLNRLKTQTVTTVDAAGAPVAVTESFTYDGTGNRLTHKNGRNITRDYTYDDLGRMATVKIGTKALAAYGFDVAGNLLTETDIHGHLTQHEYDRLYRNVNTILPIAPYLVSSEYDLAGHVLKTYDANGYATTTTYDGAYRVTSRMDAIGGKVVYTFDLAGNVVTESHSNSGLTVLNGPFDALNRSMASRKQFTDPMTHSVVFYPTTTTYDDTAHSYLTTSPSGIKTLTTVNGLGKPASITVDPGGLNLTTTYRYDEGGLLTAIKQPGSSVVDHAEIYDGLGRLVRKELPLGGVERVYYTGTGGVEKTIDARGIATRHEYDDLDRVKRTTIQNIVSNTPEQELLRFDYDDVNNTTTKWDANGHSFRSERDAMDRETAGVDAKGISLVSQWDGVNRIGEIDRKGYVKTLKYDAANRLVKLTDESGPVETKTDYYDAQNKKIDTSRGGVQKTTQYDALGRMREVRMAHPSLALSYGASELKVAERRYDGDNHLTDEIDPDGRVTLNEYDAAGRLWRVTVAHGTPSQAVTEYTFYDDGNIKTVKDPLGRITTFFYDDRHRRTQSVDPQGATTILDYDQGDNIKSMTEPLAGSHVTTYAYDDLQRLVTVDESRGGVGGTTQYVYDLVGNRMSETDASGVVRTWTYDALNRVSDSDVSGGMHWQYDYDADGNPTLTVDPAGQRVVKAYDYLNRLSTKTYSNHAAGADGQPLYPQVQTVTYTYDPDGNQKTAVERVKTAADATSDRTTTREYDSFNRLTKETNPDGKVLTYVYDLVGNRTSLTDADGIATSWTFDDQYRIKTVTTEFGSSTAQTQYDYFANGLEKAIRYPNGSTAASAYDGANRLTSRVNKTGTTVVSEYLYTYDANGNRLSETETRQRLFAGAAQSTTYEYDVLNRLSKVTYGTQGSLTYTYAANGNRLTDVGTDPTTGQAVDRTFVYDPADELLRIVSASDPDSSVALQYDPNGNTTGKQVGRLAGATIPSPRESYTYEFDIKDRLVRATGPGGGARYQYDDRSQRTRATTPFYDIKFFSAPDGVVQEYDAASLATTTKYNFGRGLVSTVTASGGTRNSFFYLFDGLHSSSELTDESGTTQAAYAYDAWGNIRSSVDTTSNRRKYTGHYFDVETGLQDFNARYYDATTGRFLSRDPHEGDDRTPISLRPYLYAHANPLTFVDPTGLAAETPDDGLAKSTDSGVVMFAKWGSGVVKGVGNALVGDLIKQGVLGLADIAAAGLGYLAIEATHGEYVDEIGTLLQPVSAMGKAGAEKGAGRAIGEAATGFVKGMVTAPFTLPGRLVEAAKSGNPEDVGRIAVEVVQMKGQVQGAIRTAQRLAITADLMQRQRVGPKYSMVPDPADPTGKAKLKSRGPITLNDAWVLAGECTAAGVSACAFQGGFGEKKGWEQVKRNWAAKESVAGRWTDNNTKLSGDIDFEIHIDEKPIMLDVGRAKSMNARMSVDMIDTYRDHGVVGKYMPPELLVGKRMINGVMQDVDFGATWKAQGGRVELVNGVELVPSFEYSKKGIALEGYKDNIAPLFKHGTKFIDRALTTDSFMFKNIIPGSSAFTLQRWVGFSVPNTPFTGAWSWLDPTGAQQQQKDDRK